MAGSAPFGGTVVNEVCAQPAPVGGMVVDEACAQPAPLGEVIVRRLWAVLAEVCPAAVLNKAQSTPLSEAHLRRVYIDQIDFLSAQRHATTLRLGILCELMAAEWNFSTPLQILTRSRRSLELESAADEEELRMDDFDRRESRLSGELFAAGLETWTHPSTGEKYIQTREEVSSGMEALLLRGCDPWLRGDVGALCADATRAKPDQHVRLRTSRSARPQD